MSVCFNFAFVIQCASTLMTSYLPIFMYLYIFHLALPLLMFSASCIQFNSYPARFIRIKLPGVWWPYHWLLNAEKTMTFEDEEQVASDDRGVATPRRMINSKTVVTQIMQHICVLFTFGLCSPQLAVAVICAIVVTSDLLQVMIGRFVHFRLTALVGGGGGDVSGTEGGGGGGVSLAHLDNALCALSQQLSETIILVKTCFVPILTTSTLFFCFICFDMAGDKSGWRDSVWVPICFACMYVVILAGRRLLRKGLHRTAMMSNPAMFSDQERESWQGEFPSISRNTIMEIE